MIRASTREPEVEMSERAAKVPVPCDQLSDDEVVARVLAGELQLFEVLMRRHNQKVSRVVRSIIRFKMNSTAAAIRHIIPTRRMVVDGKLAPPDGDECELLL
jgi:hypothetical protein